MTIRWGILGAGKIASKWAADLPLAGNATLQAVWARDSSKAGDFASRFGNPEVCATADDLLHHPEVDAVYVATPHMLHAPGARACLEAGKPVLVEKPFGLNRAEADSIALLARSRGILCMEALWTRFLPSFQTALDLVGSGRIGEVRNVVADFGFVAPQDPSSRLWDPRSGGGSLLDIGIYPLFLARSFLGNPDRVASVCQRSTTGVDASCRVDLAWLGGQSASLHSTLVESTPCMAVIEGESGRIVLERMFHIPTTVVVHDANGSERIPPPAGGHGYEHEIRHFGECLGQGLRESPLWSLSDSLDLSLLMDRVQEAWQ
ncbi:MAG: Gfo/Idh/MocA family oxidoreductase [Fibrobacteria bacterium]|nr:Gfo/Idh/MocA family oxidoreductase [Fibrobacteria bacterium]